MSGSDQLPKINSNSPNSSSSQSLVSTSNASNKQNSILNPSNSITIQTTTISSQSIMNNNHRYVKLNVGGRLFTTSLDTLLKQDNMFRAMFSGRMDVCTDLDGYILIDRSGKHFEFILNYLRDEDTHQYLNQLLDDQINFQFSSIIASNNSSSSKNQSSLVLTQSQNRQFFSDFDLYELLKEAKFYCIQPLVTLIEQKLKLIQQLSIVMSQSNSSEPYFGSSIVSMITSKNDLHKILNSTDKPCIRLLINRHNNKYSYTNTSDDNLLKNIELFERMAIKFKNRIMFIKDTTSNEEICCWYFHGNGKKISEVCCTSIVYTTEKKQTKVEFPDSKILEEIFVNAVLFESKESSANSSNMNNLNLNCGDTPSQMYDADSADSSATTPNALEEQMPRLSIGSIQQQPTPSNGNQIVNSALNAVSSAINNINLSSSTSNQSSGFSPSHNLNNSQTYQNQPSSQYQGYNSNIPNSSTSSSSLNQHNYLHSNMYNNQQQQQFANNSGNNSSLIASTSSNIISIANSLANSARRANSGANSSLR